MADGCVVDVHQVPSPEEEEEEDVLRGELRERELSRRRGPEARLLVNLLPSLPALVAPLLSGQFVLAAASDIRKPTLMVRLLRLPSQAPQGRLE